MTDFIKQNTSTIQLASLDAFAAVLGYTRLPCGGSSYHAINDHGVSEGFEGCPTLHFGTMVMLHNADWVVCKSKNGYYVPSTDDLGNGRVLSRFITDAYTLGKAIGCTIVNKVYLQSRSGVEITCHKHLVKFVDPVYQHLFLKGE